VLKIVIQNSQIPHSSSPVAMDKFSIRGKLIL